LTGQSIWAVMRCVVDNGFLRRQHDPYAQIDQPLILSAAGRDVLNPSCLRHPWVDDAADMPCGKRAAILSVIDTQNFYNSSCAYADVVHPLISQPVMELCLQIPSYVLTYSGVDRALVRDAFRKSLPPEIAGRTTKGCTTSYFHGLIVRDLPFLREYLLDGLLSKSGIVDTVFVEASLRESSLVRDARLISPLLNAIRAEVWLRTWNSESRQSAA
ncbi:MAG: asparagine synthase-related protein, partial [Haliea sp.]